MRTTLLGKKHYWWRLRKQKSAYFFLYCSALVLIPLARIMLSASYLMCIFSFFFLANGPFTAQFSESTNCSYFVGSARDWRQLNSSPANSNYSTPICNAVETVDRLPIKVPFLFQAHLRTLHWRCWYEPSCDMFHIVRCQRRRWFIAHRILQADFIIRYTCDLMR